MATPVLFDDYDNPIGYIPDDFDANEWEWNEDDEPPEDWFEENDLDYVYDEDDDPDGWDEVDHYLEG